MKIFKLDNFISTGIVFAMLALLPVVLSNDLFDSLYNTFSDIHITDYKFAEMRTNNNVDTNIILINIKQSDNLELANILSYLNNFAPKVIGIEKLIKKSDLPQNDSLLAKAIRNSKNIILAENLIQFSKDNNIFNSAELSDSIFSCSNVETGLKPVSTKQTDSGKINNNLGFNNLVFGDESEKENITIRKFYPELPFGREKAISFATLIAWYYNPESVEQLFVRHNKSETINYRGDNRQFVFIEANKIDEVDTTQFKDKIILLGIADINSVRHNLRELYFTPMNLRSGGRSLPDMYGLEIQANIISMILEGQYYNSMPAWLEVLIAVILCYINMAILIWFSDNAKMWHEIISLCIFVILSISILYLTLILFHEKHFELNLTIVIFASSLTVFMSEIYFESIKPLTIKAFNFIKNRDLKNE
jgi:CHASE2 domain-containing sensor protein